MSEVNPVIVTIVEGLGLNFWSPESLPIPVLIVNNSEAEEAQASISLYAAGKVNVHTLSLKAHTSRDKALYLGLIEAKLLGYSHAITLARPFEELDTLNVLLRATCEHPQCFIGGTQSDRRRVWPLNHFEIEEIKTESDFEERTIQSNIRKLVQIELPGKQERRSFSDKVQEVLRKAAKKLIKK